MSETAEKIIYVTTNGPESPEKATLPFKLANAGLALDLDVVIALQGPAVYLAMPGMIPHSPGYQYQFPETDAGSVCRIRGTSAGLHTLYGRKKP